MRWLRLNLILPLLFLLGVATHLQADSNTNAESGRILKVLPFLVDTNGTIAQSPSLFDRDAYQFYLLEHTNDVSGMRIDVQWKAKHVLGSAPEIAPGTARRHHRRPADRKGFGTTGRIQDFSPLDDVDFVGRRL